MIYDGRVSGYYKLGYIVSNTYKVLNTEIGRASYKSLTSNVLCYTEFHARCDYHATKEYSLRPTCCDYIL